MRHAATMAAILSLAACGPRAGTPRGPSVEADAPHWMSRDGGAPPAPVVATDGGVAVVRPVPPPRSAKIKLTIRSSPTKARVAWGKLQLGPTPVQLDRPRDSGPVDIVVRSDGYLPVHTRLYTFRNENLLVKLTKSADRMTILGAKKELPPENPDGGAPPAP